MKYFTSVHEVADLDTLVREAQLHKLNPRSHTEFGKGKVLGLIFFNNSLRTRLSTQRAALNLGLDVIVMNVGDEGWQLEFDHGAVMNGDKAEHVKDAAAVMGRYCDIIGVRAFARLKDREEDYTEEILEAFKVYSGVPILSLESAIRHPLQSLADLMTIRQFQDKPRPRIVLSWAPHPKALPQAVPNSFAEWVLAAGLDLTITHPEGYELSEDFTRGAKLEYDQRSAFEGADFIYAKNWSSYSDYGKRLPVSDDTSWTITAEKMALTHRAKFMHCLPVRRNIVVSDEVLDGPDSIILSQAENRIYSAQAVLKRLIEAC